MKHRFLLGADGGGSKTAVVLTDLELHTVLLKNFPRSNPGDIGYDATETLLVNAFDEVCAEAGVDKSEVGGVFAGIAGLSAGDCIPRLRQALEASFPHSVVDCSHDGMNVVYNAFPSGEDGVAVICGTGSSCFVKKGDTLYRIGGFGQFDRMGNGFEIGRDAFCHAYRAMDGRDPKGWLFHALNEKFPPTCHDHIIEINGYTKNQFATFAPLVFEAAKEHGDPIAIDILRRNLHYVGELITAAGKLFDGDYPVGLAGGIFRDEYARTLLRESIPARATLLLPEHDPYYGAAAKARAIFGGEPRLKSAFPV